MKADPLKRRSGVRLILRGPATRGGPRREPRRAPRAQASWITNYMATFGNGGGAPALPVLEQAASNRSEQRPNAAPECAARRSEKRKSETSSQAEDAT